MTDKCPTCGGRGWVSYRDVDLMGDRDVERREDCPDCADAAENERLRKMHTEEMALSAKYFSENERLWEWIEAFIPAKIVSRIKAGERAALEGKDD